MNDDHKLDAVRLWANTKIPYKHYYDDRYNKNYNTIRNTCRKTLATIYTAIHKDLEYILNSPSTINRILKYISLEYVFGENPHINLCLCGKVIRKYCIVMNCSDLSGGFRL